MSPLRQIILASQGRRSFSGNHPWILANSILEPGSIPTVGEQVDLVSNDGKWIGRGLYNPNSRIRVRLYTWDSSEFITTELIHTRIDRAIQLRSRMANGSHRQALRIIFSEADQLSGLVVDKYAEHLVIQLTAAALLPHLDTIVERLFHHYRPLSISYQVDERTAKSEGLEMAHRFMIGHAPEEHVTIEENELLWTVDVVGGQKTGYYLDQRDNRLAAARWTAPDSRVLDVCCYVGGFALTIAKHCPTSQVTAIDSSEKALLKAQEHVRLNHLEGRVAFEQADFFDALSTRLDANEKFDTIVLDPPRLAGSRDQIQRALNAYHRLNYLAVRMLNPGGTLVTCSCSGRVSRNDFREMLHGVSTRTHREIQVLEERGAAPDHPSCMSCPETDYLKCIIARVL
ncbi:MAG: class I SAM-dependent rRNA methyltransferase [Pirellula sp.]